MILNIVGKDKHRIINLFDDMIQNMGYSLEEIRLIESLLFISMIPYHKDYFERQIMMYITGVKYLNKIL